MKQFLLPLLVAITAGVAQAQQVVPQGSLENWAPRPPAALAPVGWLTTDDAIAIAAGQPLPFSVGAVTRTTSSRSGTYAAQLTSSNSLLGSVPGLLLLGPRINDNSNFDIPAGVPYTSRAARLDFYYRLTGTNLVNDPAFVQVQLTRTVQGVEEVIAEAMQNLTVGVATYTLRSLQLQYRSNATPDTLRIAFASSEDFPGATVGNSLFVDDVTMAGLVTSTRDAAADAALGVYPTASSDGRFTLTAPAQPALLAGSLRVTDALGRLVLVQPAGPPAATRAVLLAGQAPGLYLLRLDTPTGPLTRKLMVQ